jgi:hypothetical protein
MRRIILLFAVSFALINCSKSSFQGKILYRYQYLDKQGKDVTNQMKQDGDTEQHYFINPANYKSFNQRNELTQLYNSSTNMYYFNVGLELQHIDASKAFPKEFKATMKTGKQPILGYSCNTLLVDSEVGPTTYFYNKKIKVNPNPFSRHRYGNWSNYLLKTKGALPLKFIVVSKYYTLIATATEVTPLKLEDKEFDLKNVLNKK